jgi:hypothetical protein
VAEIRRSRELGVRHIRVPILEALSHEWRGHERIIAVHPRRTGGRDLDLVSSEVRWVEVQKLDALSCEW